MDATFGIISKALLEMLDIALERRIQAILEEKTKSDEPRLIGQSDLDSSDSSDIIDAEVIEDGANEEKVTGATAFKIGNYLTRNVRFSEHVKDSIDLINTYLENPNTKRPANILLAAPPGSGKSFLIKQMITCVESECGTIFEEVYIPSLESRDSLVDHFERIRIISQGGNTPVVFFDEVDALVNDHPIYPNFLAPAWDGTYVHEGEQKRLPKCVFFFAGSTLSAERESERILSEAGNYVGDGNILDYGLYYEKWFEEFVQMINLDENKAVKMPDFVDRMDMIIRIPPINNVLLSTDDLLTELEDLAVLMIKAHHPGVRDIEAEAKFAIVRLLMKTQSKRTAEKAVFAAKLKNQRIFRFSDLNRRDQMVALRDQERSRRALQLRGVG